MIKNDCNDDQPLFVGIQIHEHVAGVAIGLVSKCADDGSVVDHRVLTDILVIDFDGNSLVGEIYFDH